MGRRAERPDQDVDLAHQLVRWFDEKVKPILQQNDPDRLENLEKDRLKLLAHASGLHAPVAVCFVGNSGVGKSTLINALAAGKDLVLPSGGVGPLTAQALTVTHGEQPLFRARYHGPGSLWRIVFALERTLIAEKQGAASGQIASTDLSAEAELDAETVADLQPTSLEDSRRTAEEFRRLAELLVTGRVGSGAEVGYLVDCLRDALGKQLVWGTTPTPDDRHRLDRIRRALELGKRKEFLARKGRLDDPAFLADLADHASGFLAPLILEIELTWPSRLLSGGLVLVDLPGVGIAGDPHREVTRKYVREEAQALVLVVDRGVTDAAADLLRSTEFLNRLLYSVSDPTARTATVLVAVTRIDDLASERYARDKSKRKREHLREVCGEFQRVIREQMRSQLEAVWESESGDEDGRSRVIERILGSLEVYPVSAPEYRRLLTEDDDDRPFLLDPEESQIPNLERALLRLAEHEREERQRRLREASGVFAGQLLASLRRIEALWNDQTRSSAEAEALRKDLTDFLVPLREDFRGRQGEYRGFLKNEVPKKIDLLVENSRAAAERKMAPYLSGLEIAHWATLRAAVRRGGTFSGSRQIDLPRDLALLFEEPVAVIWTDAILKEIRKQTREFGDDCVGLVARVVEWARAQGARVQPRVIEAQYEAIKSDAKRLNAVGREMVDELVEAVESQLIAKIEPVIRRKCREFVERNDDQGAGVKHRMLRLFRELAEHVAQVASDPASKVLKSAFTDIEQEIRAALRQFEDPLQAAADAIVSTHADSVKRSDAQRRGRVLRPVEDALAALPSGAQTVRSGGPNV